ncbi:MAG: hypothetical protein R3E94_06845 [Burkholderiaceae bacterium]
MRLNGVLRQHGFVFIKKSIFKRRLKMYTKRIFVSILATVTVLVSGCAFKTNSYGISPDNVDAIKSSGNGAVDVRKFETFSPGLKTLMCRGVGPVTVEPSYGAYIEKAFVDELKIAGAFDPASPNKISVKINRIESSSGIVEGKWLFSVVTSSSNGMSFNTETEYPFSSSFVGDRACQETAQAFAPAVQRLIGDIVRNPVFGAMRK